MRRRAVLLLFVPLVMPAGDAESSIRAALDDQVAAWNRGDVPAFVNFYAPDCTYIGRNVAHGRDEVLANYRKRYTGRAAMGTLQYSDVKITALGTHSAIAVGRFHLEREASAGGEASGIFSLVLVERDNRWMILLDHTS